MSPTHINTDDCWLFAGMINAYGYGRLWDVELGVSNTAHRVIYKMWVGKIPKGYHIDHLCRVRSCINPEHLEAVTIRENLLRGDTIAARNKAKRFCKYGHELVGDNVRYIKQGKYPTRKCIMCIKRKDAKRNLRIRLASA